MMLHDMAQKKLAGPMAVKGDSEAGDGTTSSGKAPSSRFRLIVERMRVPEGKVMAVECHELFGEKPVAMSCPNFPVWELEALVPQTKLQVAYRECLLFPSIDICLSACVVVEASMPERARGILAQIIKQGH